MKMSSTITELTHKELVDFFCTALYGSSYLGVDYNSDFWKQIPTDKRRGECIEDKIADILLNGGEVQIEDGYSEGEVYSDFGKVLTNKSGLEYGSYTITLDLLLSRLSDVASGKCGTEAQKSFNEIFINEDGDYDHGDADNVMQCVLFGEIIYGE